MAERKIIGIAFCIRDGKLTKNVIAQQQKLVDNGFCFSELEVRGTENGESRIKMTLVKDVGEGGEDEVAQLLKVGQKPRRRQRRGV